MVDINYCITFFTLGTVISFLMESVTAADQYVHSNDDMWHDTPHYNPKSSWTWGIIGMLIFVVSLCLMSVCVYLCRKRERTTTGRSNNTPAVHVITVKPPSYVSADPPPYTAPDFTTAVHKATSSQELSLVIPQSPQITANPTTIPSGVQNIAFVPETSQARPTIQLSNGVSDTADSAQNSTVVNVDPNPPPSYEDSVGN